MEDIRLIMNCIFALSLIQAAVILWFWVSSKKKHQAIQDQTDWLQDQVEELSAKADPNSLKKYNPHSSREVLRKYNAALLQEVALLRVEKIKAWHEAQKAKKRSSSSDEMGSEVDSGIDSAKENTYPEMHTDTQI